MTNKVGVAVETSVDTSLAEQQVNAFGKKIAQANRVQFNPVSVKSIDDLNRLKKATEEYIRVNDTLRRRMKDTNQSGKMLHELDYERMFPNKTARTAQMMRAGRRYLGEESFPGGGSDYQPGGGVSWKKTAAGVAQAGMRAAGPVGGVASNALGTGMSAGAGAGLMGLMGGMLALGVGKIVGSIAEKLDQAKDNDVAMDRLKRTLGDVNISFNALKTVVRGSADNLKVTDDEAGKLATQFAKIGNVKAGQYSSIDAELRVGGGMSRSFGLDPSQGVGVMAQMRGVGVTSNTQESRRFALLIGETIGKSNAFAKSEEVMEAIANFATSQTRNNMGAANVEGYAGMYSGMVGSGVPGLDPSGAGALLGRINAALSAGGAKGEASQFFTGSIGASMGMNPYQTRMLREGGAFATADGMFGQGSAYARYKGLKKGDARPTGGNTFLESTLAKLRGQYGEGSDELADATSNHMGIGINQAMALLSVKPNQMGKLKKYGDLTKFNAESVLSLAKINDGTDEDRKGIYSSLMARKDISIEEKSKLKDDMAGAGGNVNAQKEILSVLVAQKGQEITDGKVIRDQKAQIDNIATRLAGEMIPAINAMKGGILHMAGVKDGKSPREILEGVMRAEGKDKLNSVAGEYGARTSVTQKSLDSIKKQKEDLTLEYRKQYGKFTTNPEEYHRQMKELSEKEAAATEAHNKAKAAYTKAIEKATQEIDDGITDAQLGLAPGTTSTRRQAAASGAAAPAVPGATPAASGSSGNAGDAPVAAGGGSGVRKGGKGGDNAEYDHLFTKYGKQYGVDPTLLKAIGTHESSLNPNAVSPANANGTRDYGLMQHNSKYMAGRGLTNDWSNPERSIEEGAKLLAGNIKRAGNVRTGVRMYNGSGPRAEGYANTIMDKWGRTKISDGAAAGATPLPDGAGTRPGDAGMIGRISAEPITVIHQNKDGSQAAPRQQLQTKVSAPRPFGSGASGSW